MLKPRVELLLSSALEGRRLLAHPFYRRWEAGALGRDELSTYAGQYRHFEAALPGMLSQIAQALPSGRARSHVEANLDDELGPVSHLAMFDAFAAAVGAPSEAEAEPATVALVDTYRALVEEGPVPGLAGLAAYEAQSSDIAATKGDGLRSRYRIGEQGCEFWDVHAVVDASHASWTLEALADTAGEDSSVLVPATRGAIAWWEFLDEREAAVTTAA